MHGGFRMSSSSNRSKPLQTYVVIGTRAASEEVSRILLLRSGEISCVGRVEIPSKSIPGQDPLEDVASCLRTARPDFAVVSMPAVFSELLTEIRTLLRRQGTPERFIPTVDDLIAGVGPRSLPDVDPSRLLDREPRPLDHDRIRRLCRGRRVLVTGAGGSIGSELSLAVAAYAPSELVMMDRSEHAVFEIDRRIARRHPSITRRASLQDVADRAGTLRLFEAVRPNVVIHAAAHKHVPLSEDHPSEAVRNNLHGSVSAVDAAVAVGASTFVLVSTDKAVAPTSIMGATKRLAEVSVQRRAADAGLSCAVVRFGNVLGSSGSVLDIWAREIRDGGPLTLTDRRMTRYLMTIPEAAGLVLQSAAMTGAGSPIGQVHVLDMGAPVRIIDLARRHASAHGLQLIGLDDQEPQRAAPGTISIVETGIRPGEKLQEILAHPGEFLEPTAHVAVRSWLGPVPEANRIHWILERTAAPPGGCPVVVAEAIRRAVLEVDGPESEKTAVESVWNAPRRNVPEGTFRSQFPPLRVLKEGFGAGIGPISGQ